MLVTRENEKCSLYVLDSSVVRKAYKVNYSKYDETDNTVTKVLRETLERHCKVS